MHGMKQSISRFRLEEPGTGSSIRVSTHPRTSRAISSAGRYRQRPIGWVLDRSWSSWNPAVEGHRVRGLLTVSHLALQIAKEIVDGAVPDRFAVSLVEESSQVLYDLLPFLVFVLRGRGEDLRTVDPRFGLRTPGNQDQPRPYGVATGDGGLADETHARVWQGRPSHGADEIATIGHGGSIVHRSSFRVGRLTRYRAVDVSGTVNVGTRTTGRHVPPRLRRRVRTHRERARRPLPSSRTMGPGRCGFEHVPAGHASQCRHH